VADFLCDGGGGYAVDDDAHQLGGEGCTQIAAGGHEGVCRDARVREIFLHHNQCSGPQHRGASTDQDTGNKGGEDGRGQADHDIADGGAQHTGKQDTENIFAKSGVENADKAQQDRKHGDTQDITQHFRDMQGIFHVS